MKWVVLFFSVTMAKERPQSFIVKLHSDRTEVLVPVKYHPQIHLILENKSLAQAMGKIVRGDGTVLSYASIRPSKTKSILLGLKPNETLHFVPLSPPFQKVKLKLGMDSYEIPAQR